MEVALFLAIIAAAYLASVGVNVFLHRLVERGRLTRKQPSTRDPRP